MASKKPWDDLLSAEDMKVIEESGWGKRRGFGKNPAVIVIDAQYAFVGEKKNILSSIKGNSMGIGDAAWKAVDSIKTLLDKARESNIPVIYCKVKRTPAEHPFNWAMFKRFKTNEPKLVGVDAMDIVTELTPQEGEIVITKQFPSGFFATPLASYLNTLGIDTLIITGFVTSGCVRATVNDACQLGYNTMVVAECVADRITISHKIELLDMDLKYADVVSLDDAMEYIKKFNKA
jgi:nicotinamidase-related amidase